MSQNIKKLCLTCVTEQKVLSLKNMKLLHILGLVELCSASGSRFIVNIVILQARCPLTRGFTAIFEYKNLRSFQRCFIICQVFSTPFLQIKKFD